MNRALKIALVSLGVGAVTGVLVDRIEAIYWQRKNHAELMEIIDPETGRTLYDDIPEGINEIEDEPEKVREGTPHLSMEKPSLEELVDYTKFYEGGKAKHGDAKTETSPTEVISEEEFVKRTGNLDGYASVTGTWFEEDGVLAGWDDQLEVKDVDTTIGREALAMFDDDDIQAIYVRNDLLEVLYEIVRGEGSYDAAKAEADSR